MLQINKISKATYKGKNQAALLTAKEENDYKSDEWLTFLQAKDLKLKIKKGAKGVSIFKGFETVSIKNKDGKLENKSFPMGFSKVFNMDCTEKYEIEG